MTLKEKKTCCVCEVTSEDEKLDGTFVKINTVNGIDVCEDCDDRVKCQACNAKVRGDDIETCAACGDKICSGCVGELPVRHFGEFCVNCIERAETAFEAVLGQPIF